MGHFLSLEPSLRILHSHDVIYMLFFNSNIKSHYVHFTFGSRRSLFCSKSWRKTKKAPLGPSAPFCHFLSSAYQDKSHTAKHTGWSSPALFGIPWTDSSALAGLWCAHVQTLPVGLPQGDLCTFRASLGFTGSSNHRPFIILKPSFGCIMLWATKEEPSVSMSEPNRFPLSEAAGGENTWLLPQALLGKVLPISVQETMWEQRAVLSATISAQVPKEPRLLQPRWQSSRGNRFPGSIYLGEFQ